MIRFVEEQLKLLYGELAESEKRLQDFPSLKKKNTIAESQEYERLLWEMKLVKERYARLKSFHRDLLIKKSERIQSINVAAYALRAEKSFILSLKQGVTLKIIVGIGLGILLYFAGRAITRPGS